MRTRYSALNQGFGESMIGDGALVNSGLNDEEIVVELEMDRR